MSKTGKLSWDFRWFCKKKKKAIFDGYWSQKPFYSQAILQNTLKFSKMSLKLVFKTNVDCIFWDLETLS